MKYPSLEESETKEVELDDGQKIKLVGPKMVEMTEREYLKKIIEHYQFQSTGNARLVCELAETCLKKEEVIHSLSGRVTELEEQLQEQNE